MLNLPENKINKNVFTLNTFKSIDTFLTFNLKPSKGAKEG